MKEGNPVRESPGCLGVIAFVALFLLLISCSSPNEIRVDSFNSVIPVTIDGCEYLIYDGYNSGGIIHKANCKNHK